MIFNLHVYSSDNTITVESWHSSQLQLNRNRNLEVSAVPNRKSRESNYLQAVSENKIDTQVK